MLNKTENLIVKDCAEWHNWQISQGKNHQQTRNQLGTPGGEEFSEGGPNFTSIACTKTIVMHTICPRHFFRGGSKFSRGAKPSP